LDLWHEILVRLPFRLFMGGVCAWIALRRGRSPTPWFFIGVVVPQFAMIPLVLVRDLLPAPPAGRSSPPQVVPPPEKPGSGRPSPAGGEWWYAEEGRPLGPLLAEEMRARVMSGRIVEGQLVWRPGWGEWRPLQRADAVPPHEESSSGGSPSA
jgi:hypothetical protein